MTDADERSGFTPPYNVPWATFLATVEKVAADLPNRIDRYYLANQSGSTQTYLISAFKGFGLINDELAVDKDLWKPLAVDNTRKAALGDLLRRHYPKAVELGGTNATDGELNEAFAEMFPSVTGESRVKAMRFYLFGAAYSDLPRSPLWKAAKAGSSAPRRGRPRKEKPAIPVPPVAITQSAPVRSLREFVLPSGRTLTVSLNEDLMALDRVERKFVMGIIDQIEELAEQEHVPARQTAKKPKADEGVAASQPDEGEQAGS